MRRNCALVAILRDDRNPFSGVFLDVKRTLLIAWPQARRGGKNPNLQEVHRLGLRCVVFAVADSCSRAHPLHITNANDGARARAVFVRQLAEQPNTACQRKPTAPLALSSTERLHKKPFACLPTPLRPSRPAQKWVFHQAQTEIDNSPNPAI